MNTILKTILLAVLCLVSAFGASAQISSEPEHMALCATDRSGRTVYITRDGWLDMGENQKRGYAKKGICLLDNGEGFIVAMRDAGELNWFDSRRVGAPTKVQIELIFKHKPELNDAFNVFGGECLKRYSCYWTCESCDSSTGWYMFMDYGSFGKGRKDFPYLLRTVAPLP